MDNLLRLKKDYRLTPLFEFYKNKDFLFIWSIDKDPEYGKYSCSIFIIFNDLYLYFYSDDFIDQTVAIRDIKNEFLKGTLTKDFFKDLFNCKIKVLSNGF